MPQPGIAQGTVRPGERLSEWLLRQPDRDLFLPSLQWQVPAEQASQEQLRRAVVQALGALRGPGLDAAARDSLVERLLALPLTGRVMLALPDAHWMQASPEQDPLLQENHRVVLPPRPVTVTVWTDDRTPCAALHAPGTLIQDYLKSCFGADAFAIDEAWLIQADGRSTRYGVAAWNATAQAEPGAGAWIWAPRRRAAVPKSLSDNLARFLATQLPGEQVWPQWHAVAQRVVVDAGPVPKRAPRGPSLTASDWGEIGLMQTPSARMAQAGALRSHIANVAPYTRISTMVQPLDWLEAGFRYSDIRNRLYGPSIAGTQSYKDKSFDVKLRLREESDFWPQVSLGVRDLGGTGLFSGEYLVGSKRWGDLDWSLGLGWGYLGTSGNVKNPLSILGKGFNTRPAPNVGTGGTVNLSSMFRGPTALFGGVQWNIPESPWILKLELDGNNYQSEPLANNQSRKSPINVGAVYRYHPNLDFSFGLERGNRLMLGLTLHTDLDKLNVPKVLDPPLPKLRPGAPAAVPAG